MANFAANETAERLKVSADSVGAAAGLGAREDDITPAIPSIDVDSILKRNNDSVFSPSTMAAKPMETQPVHNCRNIDTQVAHWVQIEVFNQPKRDDGNVYIGVALFRHLDTLIIGNPQKSIQVKIYNWNQHLFRMCHVGDVVLVTNSNIVGTRLKTSQNTNLLILYRILSTGPLSECPGEHLNQVRELVQWANALPIIKFELERNQVD